MPYYNDIIVFHDVRAHGTREKEIERELKELEKLGWVREGEDRSWERIVSLVKLYLKNPATRHPNHDPNSVGYYVNAYMIRCNQDFFKASEDTDWSAYSFDFYYYLIAESDWEVIEDIMRVIPGDMILPLMENLIKDRQDAREFLELLQYRTDDWGQYTLSHLSQLFAKLV
jgi:hypothetical protein